MSVPGSTVHAQPDALRWGVLYNGELVALFKLEADADAWVAANVFTYGDGRGTFDVAERQDA